MFDKWQVSSNTSRKVICFDAMCNLCLKSIEFVRKKVKIKNIEYVPLQVSEFAQEGGGSIIFIENNRIYRRSDAILRIARHLRWPWSLLYYLLIVPGFIRDFIYNMVAQNRYRWFGRCNTCGVKV